MMLPRLGLQYTVDDICGCGFASLRGDSVACPRRP